MNSNGISMIFKYRKRLGYPDDLDIRILKFGLKIYPNKFFKIAIFSTMDIRIKQKFLVYIAKFKSGYPSLLP